MRNSAFLRIIAMVARGDLNHLTFCLKGSTGLSLEDTAKIIYPNERKRALFVGKWLAPLIGWTAFALLILAAVKLHGSLDTTEETQMWTYPIVMVSILLTIGIFNGARTLKWIIRDELLLRGAAATYTSDLIEFANNLYAALGHLDMELRALPRTRDDVVAKANELLDGTALKIASLEKELERDLPDGERIALEESADKLRTKVLRPAYAVFSKLRLVSGGYSSSFRKAYQALEEPIAA